MVTWLPNRCLWLLARAWLLCVALALGSSWAGAEIVPVLGRGQVDLTDYECKVISSPIIKKVCYEKQRSLMLVKVDKKWYQYCAVEPEIYDSFIESNNAARYYSKKVKDTLDCFH